MRRTHKVINNTTSKSCYNGVDVIRLFTTSGKNNDVFRFRIVKFKLVWWCLCYALYINPPENLIMFLVISLPHDIILGDQHFSLVRTIHMRHQMIKTQKTTVNVGYCLIKGKINGKNL